MIDGNYVSKEYLFIGKTIDTYSGKIFYQFIVRHY